jgi:hypothetical protein
VTTTTVPTPDLKVLARKTFRFDWFTALIVSALVLSSAVVLWLSAVWVTNQVWKPKVPAVGVQVVEVALDAEEGMTGDDPQLGENQAMTPSQLPAREENLLVSDTEAPEILSSVLTAIAEHQADFAPPKRQLGEKSAGRPGAAGGTGKEGTGEGSSAIPRFQRWQIYYDQSQTLLAYARQLDFFGIELGVVRGGQDLVLISSLASNQPVIKRAAKNDERLFFVWKDAGRRDADLQLVQRAGISTENVLIAQFVPPQLEEQLARLEQRFANKRPEEIRMTQFGIRPAARGFEFFVMRQTHNQ